jgi:hypothetical protein
MNAIHLGVQMQRNSFFLQTFSLRAGLKKFGTRGKDAAIKEISQLHHRAVFVPIKLDSLSPTERKKIMRSLTFFSAKRDGTIKSRSVTDGSIQRQWMGREDKSNPTAQVETILLTADIDAKENRDVATIDNQMHFIKRKLRTRTTMVTESP